LARAFTTEHLTRVLIRWVIGYPSTTGMLAIGVCPVDSSNAYSSRRFSSQRQSETQ
jgi:hypothetical protein